MRRCSRRRWRRSPSLLGDDRDLRWRRRWRRLPRLSGNPPHLKDSLRRRLLHYAAGEAALPNATKLGTRSSQTRTSLIIRKKTHRYDLEQTNQSRPSRDLWPVLCEPVLPIAYRYRIVSLASLIRIYKKRGRVKLRGVIYIHVSNVDHARAPS